MPVTLSIKNVPDSIARRLRERATRNRRSLQAELLSLVEHALGAHPAVDLRLSRRPLVVSQSESATMIRRDREGRRCTVEDLYDYVSSLGKGTPDEATSWIRQARSKH